MTIFFHADHHFQHKNILEFRSKETNELLRPNFKDINQPSVIQGTVIRRRKEYRLHSIKSSVIIFALILPNRP